MATADPKSKKANEGPPLKLVAAPLGSSVIERIEKCDQNKRRELDLTGLKLSIWPQEVVLVPTVKCIKAYNNYFVNLPSLDVFRGLIDLDLSRNAISDLSDASLDKLVNLRSINLSRNRLKSIPEQLLKLALLEQLDVNRNCISAFPEEMNQMRSLRRLDASYNEITFVGTTFDSLSLLEELNLTHNPGIQVDSMGVRTRRLYEKVIRMNE
jgi:Leucine-rich repeat (LRR) protein